MNKTKHIELEGNFGSQDPALQPTADDFAAISRHIQEQKQRRIAEAKRLELRSKREKAA